MGEKLKKFDFSGIMINDLTKEQLAQIAEIRGIKIADKTVAEIVQKYSPDEIMGAAGYIQQMQQVAMSMKYGSLTDTLGI